MIRLPVHPCARRPALLTAALAAAAALLLSPAATAEPEDCDETLILYDPHDLLWKTGALVDLSTVMEVENLVGDYTEQIDAALEAESEDLEPPDGVSSDDLIDEARWDIEDAIDLGRSIAGCED